MRSTVVLFFFALVMPPVSALGQGSGEVVSKTLKVERSQGGPEASQADAKAPAKTADYSAESIVVERLDTVYRLAADGTGVREISAVTLIQSDAATRQYGVLTFPFAGNNEHVEFEYVRVKKPDGSVVETLASDAQEMPQEVTRQAPFYSDLKEKQLPVRNLRAGDRLEYKARIVVTKAEAPGQFWGHSIEMQLASAQLASGKTDAGSAILVQMLPRATEPLLLNNGAYELSKAGLEPELAQKAAQKAVDLLTPQSKDWKLTATEEERKKQLAQQSMFLQRGTLADGSSFSKAILMRLKAIFGQHG